MSQQSWRCLLQKCARRFCTIRRHASTTSSNRHLSALDDPEPHLFSECRCLESWRDVGGPNRDAGTDMTSCGQSRTARRRRSSITRFTRPEGRGRRFGRGGARSVRRRELWPAPGERSSHHRALRVPFRHEATHRRGTAGMLRTVDPVDEMLARRVRPLLVTFVVLFGVTFVLATVGRSWSWTGFSGNENVWEWLQLLAQPVAL